MFKLIGVALLCAAATVFLRETGSPVTRFVPLAGSVLILTLAFSSLGKSLYELTELLSGTAVSEYAGTLLRALGIGYAAELTSDVCRSCGADSAASSILLLGKAELVSLACPLLVRLLDAASSMIA